MPKKQNVARALALPLLFTSIAFTAFAQAPEGPLPPQPGAQIQPAPPPSQTKIAARVNLVSAPVSVRDSHGALVHDLDEHDFQITDNGIPQKISHFDIGGDPISLVVVVETSSRVDPFLPQLRKMGILFSEQVMGPEAEAAIIGFDENAKTLQAFTRNHDAIDSAFSSLQSGESGVHLFDAMAAGVEMLTGRNQPAPEAATHDSPSGRRVLLVLSEALDTGSDAHLGEILRRAQLENITIFAVGLSSTRADLQDRPRQNAPVPITPPGTFGMPGPPGTVQTPTTEANQRDAGIDLIALAQVLVTHTKSAVTKHALELAAFGTGGSYYSTFKGHSIEAAIDEIGGQLHSQYLLSYTPLSNSANGENFGYHQISISLVPDKSKNRKITTRPGYYIPPPGS